MQAGMMETSQKLRLKHLLIETIQVLCKNSLPNESSFCIEATIGITLSSNHAMVISFKERIKSDGSHLSLMMADELEDHESEEQQGKNVDENRNQSNVSRSYSRGDSDVKRLVCENPTVCEPTSIHNRTADPADQETNVLVNNADNSSVPSHIASFGDMDMSAVNHYHIPMSDNYCYTATQSLAGREIDSKDGIVMFDVVGGSDNVHTASGMHQFGTESAARPEQSHLNLRRHKVKRRRGLPHERSGGSMVHSDQRQTSNSVEPNEMQHIDGSHQPAATFDAS